MSNKSNPSFLSLPNGKNLAYHHTRPTDNSNPSIIFLGGFKSDMEGSKALALESFCQQNGFGFTRFDYSGHGQSSDDFIDGTIGQWKEDAIAILDHVTTGQQILIGSSMGGWIMLLVALERQQHITGLMGIAAAPDFTEELIWNSLKKHEQECIISEGIYVLPNDYCDDPQAEQGYPITQKLIEDGRNHLVLGESIPITCPIRLIHGKQDADVPYTVSQRLADNLQSKQINVTLVEQGDHRMSHPDSLAIILSELNLLLESAKENTSGAQ